MDDDKARLIHRADPDAASNYWVLVLVLALLVLANVLWVPGMPGW